MLSHLSFLLPRLLSSLLTRPHPLNPQSLIHSTIFFFFFQNISFSEALSRKLDSPFSVFLSFFFFVLFLLPKGYLMRVSALVCVRFSREIHCLMRAQRTKSEENERSRRFSFSLVLFNIHPFLFLFPQNVKNKFLVEDEFTSTLFSKKGKNLPIV